MSPGSSPAPIPSGPVTVSVQQVSLAGEAPQVPPERGQAELNGSRVLPGCQRAGDVGIGGAAADPRQGTRGVGGHVDGVVVAVPRRSRQLVRSAVQTGRCRYEPTLHPRAGKGGTGCGDCEQYCRARNRGGEKRSHGFSLRTALGRCSSSVWVVPSGVVLRWRRKVARRCYVMMTGAPRVNEKIGGSGDVLDGRLPARIAQARAFMRRRRCAMMRMTSRAKNGVRSTRLWKRRSSTRTSWLSTLATADPLRG